MSWLVRVALILISVPVALMLPGSAAQAQTAILQGRVQDGVTRSAIVNATVVIEGVGTVITNQQGEFRFNAVPLGSHQLRAQALGYAEVSLRIELRADTSLSITLNPNPVRVDSLRVNARSVNISGVLTDRVTGRPIMDGAVFASQQRYARTNIIGRFQFKRVPAGVPFEIQVVAFAYEAVLISVLPERDTTVSFALVIDTTVQRLIDRQLERLDVRLTQTVGKAFAIPREKLAKFDRGTLGEALAEILKVADFNKSSPTVCVYVDEKQMAGDPMLFPDEVERVEYLFDGAAIRIYTRRFMAHMISSDVKLAKPGVAQPPRGFQGRMGPPLCAF